MHISWQLNAGSKSDNDEKINNIHQPDPIIIAVNYKNYTINIIWIDVVEQEKIETKKPIVNLSMTMFASSPLETGWREEWMVSDGLSSSFSFSVGGGRKLDVVYVKEI